MLVHMIKTGLLYIMDEKPYEFSSIPANRYRWSPAGHTDKIMNTSKSGHAVFLFLPNRLPAGVTRRNLSSVYACTWKLVKHSGNWVIYTATRCFSERPLRETLLI